MSEKKKKVEFGDFQTPLETALTVCELLHSRGINPKTVIEPNCGVGAFLSASLQTFPGLSRAYGFDLNAEYIQLARESLSEVSPVSAGVAITVQEMNFFSKDWGLFIADLPQPVLLVGNPPWVTNSALGRIESRNLPEKANRSGMKGLDALTGKSNFDISEWMLVKLLEAIQSTSGRVAMLIKTSVARKIVKHAHDQDLFFSNARLYPIDSKAIFGVAVDACLFEFQGESKVRDYRCAVYPTFESLKPVKHFGFVDGNRVSDVSDYSETRSLDGKAAIKWRSGLKHDCSGVMELRLKEGQLRNGASEVVEIEDDFIYTLLKSSDLSKTPLRIGEKFVIVTQRKIGEDTRHLEKAAPKTWQYLLKHQSAFDARKSSIYKGKPPFSIFGVGEYSFAPWKVAISGLYKQSLFTLVGPLNGKPVMLDDTCYFLPFASEAEARKCLDFLNSGRVQEFLRSIIFWDAKRPISADLLQRINLDSVLSAETVAAAAGKNPRMERNLLPRAESRGR